MFLSLQMKQNMFSGPNAVATTVKLVDSIDIFKF